MPRREQRRTRTEKNKKQQIPKTADQEARKVSFTDSAGTEHAVEVEAGSLYDAVGLAIARFHGAQKEMLCVEPRCRFTVEMRQPTTTHAVEYAAFAKWMNERYGSARERAVRAKLKEALKHRPVVTTGMG
jgi:hypothetical protein